MGPSAQTLPAAIRALRLWVLAAAGSKSGAAWTAQVLVDLFGWRLGSGFTSPALSIWRSVKRTARISSRHAAREGAGSHVAGFAGPFPTPCP
jgi:hypothetical protein